MTSDMMDIILELRDYVLDHLALFILFILLSVGFGLLYPESQLLRTYSTYFNVNNIDFSVVVMVANVIVMYSPAYIILKLLGKDTDEYLSLNISQ